MKKHTIFFVLLPFLFQSTFAQNVIMKRIVHDNLSNINYEIQDFKYQSWIVDNLRSKKYVGNKTIPMISDTNLFGKADFGAAHFNDKGFLYNWFVVETQNICPWGWKVPSLMDFDKLINYLDNDSSQLSRFYNYWEPGIKFWTENFVSDKFAISVMISTESNKLTLKVDSMTLKTTGIYIRCIKK